MADNIEAELEAQLASQREALASIDEAINMGVEGSEGHTELLQMRDELRAAVSELESALLELKRSRILQQLAARTTPTPALTSNTAHCNPPPTAPGAPPATAIGPSSLPVASSLCHFRYMDGRWYAGRVRGPGRQAGTLCVAFEVPTRPFMLDPVDVMETLVQHCGGSGTAAGAAVPPPPQQQLRQGEGSGSGAGVAHWEEVALGRRALALLPGSRLYVPVEVVALDAARATATVLPLLPPHQQQEQQPDVGRTGRRDGGGGGGNSGGREVVVPLARVIRHAHVAPPPAAWAAAGAAGGAAGESPGSNGDDGGGDGSSRSSDSVSALLRPAVRSDDDGEGEEYDDEYDDDEGEEDNNGQGEEDMDLYGSDDDGGGSAAARRGLGDRRRSGTNVAADNGDGGEEGAEGRGSGLDMFGHARSAAAAGAMGDVALLAEWEAHSRGVASRLLVRMGYVRGRGLGNRGQGSTAVPEVLLLPERRGLGAVDRDRLRKVGGGVAKRRNRGGSKRKKAITAAREARAAAREAEEGAPGGGGLFDFINSSLGDSSVAARIRKAQVAAAGAAEAAGGRGGGKGGGGSTAPTAGAAAMASAIAAAVGGPPRPKAPDRRGLMSHHDQVAGIQTKLSRLQEMLGRHRDNRSGLRTQIEAQIRSAQAELAAAQSAAARIGKAIHDKDAQKKWLKF